MQLKADRIVIVGDLHGRWNDADTRHLSLLRPDLVIFVGDLGSGTLQNELLVLSQLGRLDVPGLVMPGNNDAAYLAQLRAELSHQAGALDLLSLVGRATSARLVPVGYSMHELRTEQGSVCLIAGRPCSMGGRGLAFPEILSRNYGVTTIEESTEKLISLVEKCEAPDIVFLAHNGPFGLGEGSSGMYGRDFPFADERELNEPLDWGDRDLTEAIAMAKKRGKRVLGVVAGHMHRRPKKTTDLNTQRPLQLVREETVYVNPAVVPRIASYHGKEQHHFVELRLRPQLEDPQGRFAVSEGWVLAAH